jgi:hypothetical protein
VRISSGGHEREALVKTWCQGFGLDCSFFLRVAHAYPHIGVGKTVAEAKQVEVKLGGSKRK